MSEKQASDKIKTTVYWDRDLYERLKQRAKEEERSINAEIIWLIRQALKAQKGTGN